MRRIKARQPDLLWVYSLSSQLCLGCLFSESDYLLYHYTALFHSRLSFLTQIFHVFYLVFASSPVQVLAFKADAPAWHRSFGQPPAAMGTHLGAAKCSLSMREAARQEETVPKRLPASLPASALPGHHGVQYDMPLLPQPQPASDTSHSITSAGSLLSCSDQNIISKPHLMPLGMTRLGGARPHCLPSEDPVGPHRLLC